MKNKSFWILLTAGVLCFLLAGAVYLFGGISEELTDTINYRQTGNGGKITNETSITQSFFCKYNDITSLLMRTSTLGNTYEAGHALFTLYNEKGDEIARQEIPLSEIKDKGAVTFSFGEKIEKTGGQVLTFKAEAREMENDKCYSLMIGQGNVGGMLTTADGKTSENNSLFMTMNYLNPVKPISATFLFLIAGMVFLSLLPLMGSKKGGC